jgi:hypothetical protein
VHADLYRDYPAVELASVEALWGDAREEAARLATAAGTAPLEHSHWDWRNKADSVEDARHMLVAVECSGEVQGIMAVLRIPRAARLSDAHVIYVDYVESAPWNIRSQVTTPRFLGVGTLLLAEAVRLSIEAGHGGHVGLHSLPQAERFYNRCGMTRLGPDSDYFDLMDYEFSEHQATSWLKSVGGSP